MNKERAQEVYNFVSQLNHRMSGRESNQFFDIYKREINPKAPKVQPCSCNPNIWKQMLEETITYVDNILNPKDFSVNVEVVEDKEFAPLPTTKKKKKSEQ
jgi:hypothetical protein